MAFNSGGYQRIGGGLFNTAAQDPAKKMPLRPGQSALDFAPPRQLMVDSNRNGASVDTFQRSDGSIYRQPSANQNLGMAPIPNAQDRPQIPLEEAIIRLQGTRNQLQDTQRGIDNQYKQSAMDKFGPTASQQAANNLATQAGYTQGQGVNIGAARNINAMQDFRAGAGGAIGAGMMDRFKAPDAVQQADPMKTVLQAEAQMKSGIGGRAYDGPYTTREHTGAFNPFKPGEVAYTSKLNALRQAKEADPNNGSLDFRIVEEEKKLAEHSANNAKRIAARRESNGGLSDRQIRRMDRKQSSLNRAVRQGIISQGEAASKLERFGKSQGLKEQSQLDAYTGKKSAPTDTLTANGAGQTLGPKTPKTMDAMTAGRELAAKSPFIQSLGAAEAKDGLVPLKEIASNLESSVSQGLELTDTQLSELAQYYHGLRANTTDKNKLLDIPKYDNSTGDAEVWNDLAKLNPSDPKALRDWQRKYLTPDAVKARSQARKNSFFSDQYKSRGIVDSMALGM